MGIAQVIFKSNLKNKCKNIGNFGKKLSTQVMHRLWMGL